MSDYDHSDFSGAVVNHGVVPQDRGLRFKFGKYYGPHCPRAFEAYKGGTGARRERERAPSVDVAPGWEPASLLQGLAW